MNKKNTKENKKTRHAFLFKITSRCNDFCNFCIENEFIEAKRLDLSFEEFRKNYFYLIKEIKPDYVILTGGEPTLHPELFKMLDLVKKRGDACRVITNLINFNDHVYLDKLAPFYKNFKTKKQELASCVIGSINDLPRTDSNADLRIKGLIAALKIGLPVMITIVLYQKNIKDLPLIVARLKKIFRRYSPGKTMQIELRFIYIEGTREKLLNKSIPRKFKVLIDSVEESLGLLNSKGIRVSLWNFPLCYLKNPLCIANSGITLKMERHFIKVNKDLQLKNVITRNWNEYLKPHEECKKCTLNSICSGIDKDYFIKFNYPGLRTL